MFYFLNLDLNSNFIFIFISSMNPMFVAALAVVAVASIADATFVIGTVAATTAGAVTLSSASVASLGLLGGVVLLKGLLLGAVAARRGKRSAESDQDAAFAVFDLHTLEVELVIDVVVVAVLDGTIRSLDFPEQPPLVELLIPASPGSPVAGSTPP